MSEKIIRISPDMVRIGHQTVHLRDITNEQIAPFIDILTLQGIEIKLQIDSVDYQTKTVDRKWLSNLKASLRVISRQRIILTQRLSEIKKSEKLVRTSANIVNEIERRKAYSISFIRVAKSILPPNLYLQIATEAGQLEFVNEATDG